MRRFLLRLKIRWIRYLRDLGYLKEPKRSYLYNGKHYPFYRPKTYCTSEGKMYIKSEEMAQSVIFYKTIDKSKKYNFVKNDR